MKYFVFDAAVPGEVGRNVIADTSVHPPIVHRMHYVLDDVPTDAIFTTFPVYVVTGRARLEIIKNDLTGARFDDIEVSMSPEYKGAVEVNPGDYYWMKVEGRACHDDFGLTDSHDLIISQRAFDLFESLGILDYSIRPVGQ